MASEVCLSEGIQIRHRELLTLQTEMSAIILKSQTRGSIYQNSKRKRTVIIEVKSLLSAKFSTMISLQGNMGRKRARMKVK